MRLSELTTFEEVKQYTNDIIEFLDLFYSSRFYLCWGKPFSETGGFRIKNIQHGVEGECWQYWHYSEIVGTTGFLNTDLTDSSWTNNSNLRFAFYSFPDEGKDTFDFGLNFNKTYNKIKFLRKEELTPEMYAQLEFLYTTEIVNCIVLHSILNANGQQLVYHEQNSSPREMIDKLKEVICTHLESQQITQIKS